MDIHESLSALAEAIKSLPQGLATAMGPRIASPAGWSRSPLIPRVGIGAAGTLAVSGRIPRPPADLLDGAGTAVRRFAGDLLDASRRLRECRTELRSAFNPISRAAGPLSRLARAAPALGVLTSTAVDRLKLGRGNADALGQKVGAVVQKAIGARLGGAQKFLFDRATSGGLGSGLARSAITAGVLTAMRRGLQGPGLPLGLGRGFGAFAGGGPNRWKDGIGQLLASVKSVIPQGKTAAGVIGEGGSRFAAAALGDAAKRLQSALGGARMQSMLTPGVASRLSSRLGSFQAYLNQGVFQQQLGVRLSNAVSLGVNRGGKAFTGMFRQAIVGGTNWVGIGAALAKGGGVAGAAISAGVLAARALHGFAESGMPEARRLGGYNARIGAANTQLALGDQSRSFRLARDTATTSSNMVTAVNRMRESLQDHATFASNVGNRLRSEAASVVEFVAKGTAPFMKVGDWFLRNFTLEKPVLQTVMDKGEDATGAVVKAATVASMRVAGRSQKDIDDYIRAYDEELKRKREEEARKPFYDPWADEMRRRAGGGAMIPQRHMRGAPRRP